MVIVIAAESVNECPWTAVEGSRMLAGHFFILPTAATAKPSKQVGRVSHGQRRSEISLDGAAILVLKLGLLLPFENVH